MLHSWNQLTLYLDIDDYRSAVDIFFVEASDNGVPDVEQDVQFTYMSELVSYVRKNYPKYRYVIPDKFYECVKRDNSFEPLSHAVRLNNREILKILGFRAALYDEIRTVQRVSYPKYYITSGYKNAYDPIARDERPYDNQCEYDIWKRTVRLYGKELRNK